MTSLDAAPSDTVETRVSLRFAAGIASAVYWDVSELNGHGDLRAYVLVQFLPVVLIPLILWLFNSRLNRNNYIWGIIVAYSISKLMEFFDARIYSVFGMLSGHSLKHLIAALATYIFYRALRDRQILAKRQD